MAFLHSTSFFIHHYNPPHHFPYEISEFREWRELPWLWFRGEKLGKNSRGREKRANFI
jgi:hypothetical protein